MALSAADKARKRESMRLWIKAGGDPKEAGRAGAVSLAESGGSDKATNNNTNGTKDRGRWQINSIHGALSTHDPIGNARAAVKLSKNGRDWSPWVAYNTGAYRKFTGSVGGSGSTSGSGKSGSSTHRSASAATTTTTTSTTTPGVDNRAARAAAISAFLGSRRADPLDFALSMRGLQDVAPSPSTKTTTSGSSGASGSRRPTKATAAASVAAGARKGNYSVAPGANRSGADMTGNLRSILAAMTRSGRSVRVGTGSNHSQMTASGNVSDHWSGNGADIPTSGSQGDLIAAHAIKAASGKSWAESLRLARRGGIQNFQSPKYGRVQVIWRAAGHHDHVHVGVRK